MQYYTIQPPPQLAKFVRFFWVLESEATDSIPYIYRAMASGCAEILFHYRGPFAELTHGDSIQQSLSLIHTQSQTFRRFTTSENFGIFGIYIYPFAIPYLLKVPSYDTSNHMLDLKMVLGAKGRELEEKMMLAPDNATRVAIITPFLERLFTQHSPKDSPILSAIQYVIHSKVVPRVDQLATQFNLSNRQFERKFKEYSGFSPKLFARIIRFQAALDEYKNKHTKTLTEIAYECGYYDQSHFIHDFKAFSGYHPKQYFSGRAEGIEVRDA